jgi:hypothetical protein
MGRSSTCRPTLRGRVYPLRRSSGLADGGGRDYEHLEHVGQCQLWSVICKNKRFHRHENTMFGHRIPLGETDACSPPPGIDGTFQVRCDECGEEYEYRPDEVLRVEQSLSASFAPHPLFRDL